ncbi:MAG: SCO6880 family protein [Candidatus Dormibacteria bacterium]
MSEEEVVPHIRFPPSERPSVIFDLTWGQILTTGTAVCLAFLIVLALKSLPALLLAAAAVGVALAAAFWRVSWLRPMRTTVEWIPIWAAAAWESATGGRRWVNVGPLWGRTVALSEVVDGPIADLGATELRRVASHRMVPEPWPVALAGPLRGFALTEVRDEWGIDVGMVVDKTMNRITAAVEVRGRSARMVDTPELVSLQSKWGEIVESLARDSGCVSRTGWIEDAGVGDEVGATAWLRSHAALGHPGLESQTRLIGTGGHAAKEHRAWVTLSIDRRRAKPLVALEDGEPLEGACRVLAREVASLRTALDAAGLRVEGTFDVPALAGMLRLAFLPAEAERLAVLVAAGGALEAASCLPSTWKVTDSWVRADDTYHVSGAVQSWPGSATPVDFLVPVMMDAGVTRRIAQVLEPLPPILAMNAVGRKLADSEANARIREARGFGERAFRRRQREALEFEDEALAEGLGLAREATFVTVSAPTLRAAEAAWTRLETAFAGGRVVLERAGGLQAPAFLATLPLGRGLR